MPSPVSCTAICSPAVGVAALLLLGAITTPLILALFPGGTSSGTQNTPTTTSADGSLQSVLTQQTSLSIEEIQNQMSSRTSLATLVESSGGSINAVTTALTQAINQAIDADTIPQPMLQRMGADAAAVASHGQINSKTDKQDHIHSDAGMNFERCLTANGVQNRQPVSAAWAWCDCD